MCIFVVRPQLFFLHQILHLQPTSVLQRCFCCSFFLLFFLAKIGVSATELKIQVSLVQPNLLTSDNRVLICRLSSTALSQSGRITPKESRISREKVVNLESLHICTLKHKQRYKHMQELEKGCMSSMQKKIPPISLQGDALKVCLEVWPSQCQTKYTWENCIVS